MFFSFSHFIFIITPLAIEALHLSCDLFSWLIFEGSRESGRFWKDEVREPARKVIKGKAHHPGWKKLQERRRETEHIKKLEQERKEAEQQALEEKRARRQEKLKRRQANEKKAEQVVALNPKKLKSKLKTMSKKQLRQIRKVEVDPL